MPCGCEALGAGAQLFRIRRTHAWFAVLADFGPDYPNFLAARKVWNCIHCGQYFAFMRIPFKDEEDILVRASSGDWSNWDWPALATIAERCRWGGSAFEERYLL